MTGESNIVSLATEQRAAGQRVDRRRPSPAEAAAQRADQHQLLARVQRQADQHLTAAIERYFGNIDDALFELADRSRSDTDQHLYFESMREMRICRERIEAAFLGAFREQFHDLTSIARGSLDPLASSDTTDRIADADADEDLFETLTLIRNDELEVNVAVAGIVSKVANRLSLPLMQLTRRMEAVLAVDELSDRDHPLGPYVICNAFATAIEDVQLDIKVRLIVLKLFERLVMEQIGALFDEINDLLIAAGVLPNLKHFQRPPGRARQSANTRAGEDPAARDQVGAALEGHLPHDSADNGRQRQPGSNGAHGPFPEANPVGVGVSAGAVPVHNPFLTEHTVNSGRAGTPGIHGGFASAPLGAGAPGGPYSRHAPVAGADVGIIESVLAGQLAPLSSNAAPAGTPVLSGSQVVGALGSVQHRLATAPFNADEVPQLMDLRPAILQAAGAPGTTLARTDDDIVNLVGMLFDYILNDRNLAIPMKALLGRLQIPYLKVAVLDRSFFVQSGHPARALLNELSSVGIGWSSSRELKRDNLYDLVESIVIRVLNRFDDNIELFSTLLAELLEFRQQDERRNRVVEQRIRDAEIGKERAKDVGRKVRNLVGERAGNRALPEPVWYFIRERWSRVLTFHALSAGYSSEPYQQAVSQLDELLYAAQSLSDPAALDERRLAVPRLVTQLRDGMRHIGQSASAVDDLDAALDALMLIDSQAALDAASGLAVGASLGTDTPLPTVTPEPPVDEGTGEVEEDIDDDASATLDALCEGSWVEWQTGETPLRGKLSGIIGDGTSFVFVNRRGMKLTTKRRAELLVELRSGEATLIDERLLFERALATIVTNLRSREGQISTSSESTDPA